MTERGAVLWDMDGTLIDSEPLHHRAIERVMAVEGLVVPAEFKSNVIGLSAYATYEYCRDQLGYTAPYARWSESKHRYYLNGAPDLEAFAGPREVFENLAATHVAQAIVSNSDRLVVQANLAATGLARPEQITVSRNDVRQGKPAPESYLRAAWLLDVDPERCVVVEDSVAGATAGLAAGMAVIGIEHDGARSAGFPASVVTVPANLAGRALVERIEAYLGER